MSYPIPGPRAIPLLGWRGRMLTFARDPIAFLRRLRNEYGEVAGVVRGADEFVFFFGPDYVRQIFSDPGRFYNVDIEYSPFRFPEDTAYKRIFEGGLNQMNGLRHRQQRRLMMPSFHKKHIEAYRQGMIALTEQKMAAWERERPIDLLQEMREISSAVAVKSLFGLDPDQEEGAEMRDMFEKWQELFASPWATLLPFNLPGFTFRRLLQLSEEGERRILGLIGRKREGGADEGDVLSTLIQAYDEEDGSRLTDSELIGQISTLFIAGHETTASTLTWALLMLALHPEIAAEFLAELSPLNGEAPSTDQLNDFPVLDGVVKETLRMFPPLPWQLRYTIEPAVLGGYEISAGKGVCVSAFIAHRDPEVFEDPDCFRPSRWRDINPSAYEYFPFSSGPRLCLGAAFATMEMKIVLPLIVQRFRIGLQTGARIDRQGAILSAPSKGIAIVVEPQDGAFSKPDSVTGNIKALVEL